MVTRDKQIAFIDATAKAAQISRTKWGVPASIVIAQAILESRWGTSKLSRLHHNYFGIKARKNEPYKVFDTEEFRGGKSQRELAKFKIFPSPIECFDAHGRLLATAQRYSPAMAKADDPLAFALELQLCGYATDPKYATSIADLISRHNLTRFDAPRTLRELKIADASAKSQPKEKA